jgi:DNA-binding NarL/FixJ family response regulator
VARTRVLLADDHEVVRAGMKALLSAESDIEVVAEAADGATALGLAAESVPDVAIIDFGMPGLNGPQTAERLRDASQKSKCLVFTVHESPDCLRQALKAGARGYLLKRSASAELPRAIRMVAAGDVYIDPALGLQVANEFFRQQCREQVTAVALSEVEATVLRGIARGFSNQEIAQRIGISADSVATEKARAMKKTGLHTRVDIIRYAAKQGWVAPPDHD